jgi:6-phosphofructokinase 1
MNACIRAIVRSAISRGIKVTGINRGYQGMIEGDFVELKTESVSNIIHRGGTILKTSRSADFRTFEGRKKAYEQLVKAGINGVVAIGGDGTFTGASIFFKEFGIPVLGVPGTIDNDMYGTDFTIGYDTALNTAVEAIDRIRDTADSHNRIFFVEVMGRDAGFIALNTGIAGGAESILIPETDTDLQRLVETLKTGMRETKSSRIVVVAEGDEAGGAFKIADQVKSHFPGLETRVCILGHIQRGGNPSCRDRVLASSLGVAAVKGLLDGKTSMMVGMLNNRISYTPIELCAKHHPTVQWELLEIAEMLGS